MANKKKVFKTFDEYKKFYFTPDTSKSKKRNKYYKIGVDSVKMAVQKEQM